MNKWGEGDILYDPLQPDRIEAVIRQRLPAFRLHWCEETGSTNSDLLQLAENGAPGWTAVVADVQLSGRGRYLRRWVSPLGGIYLSVLLPLGEDPPLITLVPLAVGLAVLDAVREEARHRGGELTASIKWPNDIITPNGKLAGVLCEALEREGQWFVIAGIGINLYPLDEEQQRLILDPVTSLSEEAAVDWTRAGLIVTLVRSLANRLDLWRVRPEMIRKAWLDASQAVGREVTVKTAEGSIKGIARGLNEAGGLIVDTDEGRIVINSAEGIEEHHG